MIYVCKGNICRWNLQDWRVFREVPEFLILVTPLLGLKGNLEMTLASRLSTQANLGNLDGDNRRWTICWANLSLIQVFGVMQTSYSLSLGNEIQQFIPNLLGSRSRCGVSIFHRGHHNWGRAAW